MTNFERDIEDMMDRLRKAKDELDSAISYAEEAKECVEEVGIAFPDKVVDLMEDISIDLQSRLDEAEELLAKLEMVLA
tara:strand:+ start:208 stop:441 length:234 start_codon:yes stop_codon:yes gene_type:complete